VKRKCEACKDGPLAGILNNGERCDTCERYPSDHDAVLALVAYAHKARGALKGNLEWLKAAKSEEPEDWDNPELDALITTSRRLIRKGGGM
jgi:hypothetical protein